MHVTLVFMRFFYFYAHKKVITIFMQNFNFYALIQFLCVIYTRINNIKPYYKILNTH
ncbi:hypothetical protein NBO_25g0002 [Nosema bombycis CQ1]|uniref:Uncharacterized protein n=1 Tax=Nosema bombycis (strain CQ1 / CVCC 102059) TaxID=578461 RepID=R0KUK9_NOSB1|nr:hypothetical protein NBO_25g0002 [Nosema bombycis CQ1]|eukprot:EOB14541.1 hypothetical protein NBO_25g0002 [Nosema bombycis CQ1]